MQCSKPVVTLEKTYLSAFRMVGTSRSRPEPHIPRGNGAIIHIADVAAGPCLWSLQVAQELGSACQIEASDTNPDLCPQESLLLHTMPIQRWSFFDPVPAEWIGKFDVVHVRLIIGAFAKQVDLRPVLENLTTKLKPGGYLQWDEYYHDLRGQAVRAVADLAKFFNPTRTHRSSIDFWNTATAGYDADLDFFTQRADHFRFAGLEDIVEDRTPQQNPNVVRAWYETWLGWAGQMDELSGKTDRDRSDKLRELLGQMQHDQRENDLTFCPVTQVVFSRKKQCGPMLSDA